MLRDTLCSSHARTQTHAHTRTRRHAHRDTQRHSDTHTQTHPQAHRQAGLADRTTTPASCELITNEGRSIYNINRIEHGHAYRNIAEGENKLFAWISVRRQSQWTRKEHPTIKTNSRFKTADWTVVKFDRAREVYTQLG